MKYSYADYALLFKALSDETRLKIISMLSDNELCACRILSEFNITQPTLSYHMKILMDSSLVNGRKDGSWMRYTLNKEKSDELISFFKDITSGVNDSLIKKENCD
ncbi:MAG: metalloregulator ArsR/SmtB family transcription factor [Oscillospiraceae bacterium]|nr:metalloregulator ArsR/SmtB family transcription factor [Oscillospiraceae bacterium]